MGPRGRGERPGVLGHLWPFASSALRSNNFHNLRRSQLQTRRAVSVLFVFRDHDPQDRTERPRAAGGTLCRPQKQRRWHRDVRSQGAGRGWVSASALRGPRPPRTWGSRGPSKAGAPSLHPRGERPLLVGFRKVVSFLHGGQTVATQHGLPRPLQGEAVFTLGEQEPPCLPVPQVSLTRPFPWDGTFQAPRA